MNGPASFYRKPIQIEAWHLPSMPTDAPGMHETMDAVEKWTGGRWHRSGSDASLMIPNKFGHVFARLGTWVIRDADGQFKVRTPAEFANEYQPMNYRD